ncbi:ATP-binding cassette domain-containing protein [Marinobacter orientalis]|uniref:ATP-binding cassette domain-containing protein n=2 Tax=Marinobacter orientalis TaxID=1928859 RepID=A0A7Y0RD52_9GAMM|nr:ATP-binding cassette domain-containing protein [Marinobacter orientalis]TGX49275.1 ATP-binding cassette domain-containing protein [Marinobacter orientalis]
MSEQTTEMAPAQSRSEQAVRIIVHEHQALWRVLDLLDQLLSDMNLNDQRPDERLLTTIFDYIEHFSQRVHSTPTDIELYKRLSEKSPETAPLLEKLARGYVVGHEKLVELRELLAECEKRWPEGREEFSHALARFTEALRKHIRKEEGVVIPRARKLLTEEDWQQIIEARDVENDPLFGERVREEFRELRHQIVSYTPEKFGGLGLKHADRVTAPHAEEEMLSIKGLVTSYGQIEVLHDVDIRINSGEIVSLVGANGAGKSTLLMTISGLQPVDRGSISFEGKDLGKISTDRRVAQGIVQVPEGRQVFKDLSVHDNLLMGAYTRGRTSEVMDDIERMYTRFPILRQKHHNLAGELSGGQQQMLAMGRALMARPRLLLLDEPSMGLAPLIVEEIFNIVKELKKEGITIFLVEQNASQALALADRGYVLETGKVVIEGTGRELLSNEKVREAYLGM